MIRNGTVTFVGIGGHDFREILEEALVKRPYFRKRVAVPQPNLPPPPAPVSGYPQIPAADKPAPPLLDSRDIIVIDDDDEVVEVEPQAENSPLEWVVLDETGGLSEAQSQSPPADEKDQDASPSEENESDDDSVEDPEFDLDDAMDVAMDVVNGNVDFGEGSDASESSSDDEDYRRDERERKAKAQGQIAKALRGAKRVWDVAFSEDSEDAEAEKADEFFQLSEGPAKRKKVVARRNSVNFYEKKLRDFQWFGKSRGEGEWTVVKADARFAKNPFAAKRRSYGTPHCMNCGMRDHTTFRCPEPQKRRGCLFCDSDGHKAPRLASCQNKVCHRCLKKGHDPQRCPAVTSKCRVCKTWDHVPLFCSDFWRRFHLTTSGSVPVAAPLTSSPPPKKCPRMVHSYAPVGDKQPVALSRSKSAPYLLNELENAQQTPPNELEKENPSLDDQEPRLLLEDEEEDVIVLPPPIPQVDVVTVHESEDERSDDEPVFLLSESDAEDPESDVQQALNKGNNNETSGNANLNGEPDEGSNRWGSRNGGERSQSRDFRRDVEGEDVIYEVYNANNSRGRNCTAMDFPRTPNNRSRGRPPRGFSRGRNEGYRGRQSYEVYNGPARSGSKSNYQGQRWSDSPNNGGGFRGGRGRGYSAYRPLNRGISGGSSRGIRGGNEDGDGRVFWNGRRVSNNRS